MQTNLCYFTLGDLDSGAAEKIITAGLNSMLADLDDRGDDGKPREVNIKVILVRADDGRSDTVVAHVEVGTKCPSRRTAGTMGKIRMSVRGAEFQFQTLAPDDPNQRTIDELEGDEGHGRTQGGK